MTLLTWEGTQRCGSQFISVGDSCKEVVADLSRDTRAFLTEITKFTEFAIAGIHLLVLHDVPKDPVLHGTPTKGRSERKRRNE